MDTNRVVAAAVAVLALAGLPEAEGSGTWAGPGRLVGVSVDVGGRRTPLHPAPDTSGRYYIEAREGAPYVVRLHNRTGERLGVVLTVDGLNAISGARDRGHGRMYVLGPGQEARIRGWRTSLQEVRRFVFVDEESSYAARSGKANSRMGWIQVSVYRERRHWPRVWEQDDARRSGEAAEDRARGESPPSAPSAGTDESEARAQGRDEAGARKRSYPGTGWGARTHDRVVVVEFEPETSPAQRTTLRYEYRSALVALGVLPSPHVSGDRLRQRDRGELGFAPPPLW
jgi:hypothetical protein